MTMHFTAKLSATFEQLKPAVIEPVAPVPIAVLSPRFAIVHSVCSLQRTRLKICKTEKVLSGFGVFMELF